jgi:hypothetical protein
MPPGNRQPDQLPLLKPTRVERLAAMDEEILGVEGAARVLGVSTRTVYTLRAAISSSGSPIAVRLTRSRLRCATAGLSENGRSAPGEPQPFVAAACRTHAHWRGICV